MAGPFSSVTAPRDGAHRKNRKKKINIKAKRENEKWYIDLRSEEENGGRERVKVRGEWVTPGPASGLAMGTKTDRRHCRQTDGRGTRQTDGTAWPQAPGPRALPHAMPSALAPADTQSLERRGHQLGLSQCFPGAQQLSPRAGRDWQDGAGQLHAGWMPPS